jgi:hypothetical protein
VAVVPVVRLLTVAGPPGDPGAGPSHWGARGRGRVAAGGHKLLVRHHRLGGGVMTFGGAGYFGDTIEVP